MNNESAVNQKRTNVKSLDRDKRLDAILDQYVVDLERGGKPDRAKLLTDNADLAEELEECLQGLDFVYVVAPQLREQSQDDSATTPGKGISAATIGDFRIIREIGRGGMGVVYEAEQLSLQRRVALKILPFAAVLDQRQLQRFKNESLAAAQLDHPNIVDVFAVGSDRGVHYYAMRFIEGQTFAQVIQELGVESSESVP